MIVITGAWGSGTTALVGVLKILGFSVPGPFADLKDDKMISAFENIEINDILWEHVSKENLSVSPEGLSEKLSSWGRDGVVKHPLLGLVMPEVLKAWDPQIIVSTRPFDDIRATNERRGWSNIYLHGGAFIYRQILLTPITYLSVSYPQMIAEPEKALDMIAGHLGTKPTDEMYPKVRRWLKRK